MYMLIVFLLLMQLIIGHGVSFAETQGRRGPFMEVGLGVDTIGAYEDWVFTYRGGSATWHHQLLHNKVAFGLYPTGNLKIGWGFTEKLLFSGSLQFGKLFMYAPGIVFFQKKTIPSLFYDAYIGRSVYYSSALPERFSDAAQGIGISFGIGREFKKHIAMKLDFNLGVHDFYEDDSEPKDFFAALFDAPHNPNYINGKTVVFGISFKVCYIWY